MKDIKEIDVKELKLIVKEYNDAKLAKKKIKVVGATNEQILKDFSEAIEGLPEEVDIPTSIATFYNDIYADEMDESTGDEIDPEDESVEDGDEIDPEDEEIDPEDEEIDPEDESVEDGDEIDPEEEPIVIPVKEKKAAAIKAEKVVPVKENKPPLIREKPVKSEPKERGRATVNDKMSLAAKVKNILNFKEQGYKQTTYFDLDCGTVKILETNVGLFPTEIFNILKQDKHAAKKIEKFSDVILMREINKIKSAYSYIVGAVKDTKTESKFRHIMASLVEGKKIPVEVAHPSTVKVARRALLAYMHCQKIDYKILTEARNEMMTEKPKKPVLEAVAPKEKKVKPSK